MRYESSVSCIFSVGYHTKQPDLFGVLMTLAVPAEIKWELLSIVCIYIGTEFKPMYLSAVEVCHETIVLSSTPEFSYCLLPCLTSVISILNCG